MSVLDEDIEADFCQIYIHWAEDMFEEAVKMKNVNYNALVERLKVTRAIWWQPQNRNIGQWW